MVAPTAVRLWAKVAGPWTSESIGPDDCWLWQGGVGQSRRPKSLPEHKPYKRYGRFSLNGRLVGPHRVAYELTYGELPEGHVAGHRCDNGLCCNPAHLVGQPQAENIAEALERGRLSREEDGCRRFLSTYAPILEVAA